MAAMTKETTGTTASAGASPQKQALLEAFDSVLKKQAEDREAEQREAADRRRRQNRVRPTIGALAGLAVLLCVYLYLDRPEWLFPSSTPPESVAIKEASLRIGMANAAQHVERFRQQTGKLPKTLAEAGTRVDGIAYQAIDSADWRLVGTHDGIELSLSSREPLSRFLGNSYQLISRRSR
jgi:hypothetical protein